jgi:uncharacterized membrane protein YdfJ with MMPL/SSD domain
MNPQTPPRRLTERIATAVQAAPRRSLLLVLLFVIVAGVVGGPVTGALRSDGGFSPADADSVRAVDRIEAATGREPTAGIVLLVATTGGSREAGAVRAELAAVPGIARAGLAGPARDGRSALVTGTLRAGDDDDAVAERVVEAFEDDDGVTVGGTAVAGLQLGEQVESDLSRAELFALPVLVLLSILIFGSRAALLPLAVGLTTVVGTFLALAGINQLYGLNVFVLNLVIGLGLGLAVDYSLFLISRYREELAVPGTPPGRAGLNTLRSAGRTVVYSAVTVAVALATLTVFPLGFLRSMGIAGATTALVAAAAALVVPLALFGLWGEKLARRRSPVAAEGRWYRFSHTVMRRPGVIAAVTAALMLVLAAPALRAAWTPVDSTVIPPGLSARVVSDTVAQQYGGSAGTPVTVVVGGGDPAAVREFAARASAVPGVLAAGGPVAPVDLGSRTWQVDLPVGGDAAGPVARQVVSEVRAVAAGTGTDALVTGPAAEFLAQQDAVAGALPFAAGLLVLLTMLVLWLMTGSVVLPVKAVVMNLLTVGVSLGAITFVYQDGRLSDLLGYTPNGGVEPTNFLVTAALVFALSTDYGVFLLGRIKEARDSGVGEREAVATGLGRTGSIVTAAALLLAVAIGAFSTSEISFMQQIGIATAVGVLVDAFVVRSLLVPSLMALMGRWNWWSPAWLRRVHDRIGLSEGLPEPAPAATPAGLGAGC